MSSKQVKQSTFDTIVREGIQEFGLSAEEAVADACEQLRKSGVTNLSNLDVSVPSEVAAESGCCASHVNAVRGALQSKNPSHLINSLVALNSSTRGKRDAAKAVLNGAIDLLAECMQYSLKLEHIQRQNIVRPICELIVTLCMNDELNRTAFVGLKAAQGLGGMKSLFNSFGNQGHRDSVFDFETCGALVQSMCSIQRNDEHVKQFFAANESLDCLIKYFENACDGIINNIGDMVTPPKKLFLHLCLYTRQLLSPDDASVKVTETFNRARVLAGDKTVTESGLRPLSTSSNLLELFSKFIAEVQASDSLSRAIRRQLLTECFACIRTCCVSDEICSQIVRLNMHKSCIELLEQFKCEEITVSVCVGVLRNLAGRDECKTDIFESTASVTEVVKQHLGTCSKIGEQYCGLIGSLSLRRPDLANKIVKLGMAEIILDVMDIYDENKVLQRVGCLAIRNICARDVEARRHMREKGLAEKIIRKAWRRHAHCDDVAYAALRDMDVLDDDELRRDERYTMPAGFYKTPVVREKDT